MSEDRIIVLLEEMNVRQAESVALQKEQYEFVKKHYDRAEAIQDKAETLQDNANKIAKLVFPLIFICFVILIVLMFLN